MRLLLTLLLSSFLSGTVLFGQEKFERNYRSFADGHLASAVTAVGEGYAILSGQLDRDSTIRRFNVLTLNNKGNIDWSNTYDFQDTIAQVGDLIRLANGDYAFSGSLMKDSLNKVVAYIDSGGSMVWNALLGDITADQSLDQARLLLTDIPEEKIIHITVVADPDRSAEQDIMITSVLYDGTIEYQKRWTGPHEGSVAIEDMITTIDTVTMDTTVLLLGTSVDPENPIFLANLDKDGNLLWTKSYNNAEGFTESLEGLRIVQLIGSDVVIAGSLEGRQTSGFVLRLTQDGEIRDAFQIESLTQESFQPTDVIGLIDTTLVISIQREVRPGEVVTSLVNFDMDSLTMYQTTLDTTSALPGLEAELITADSMSVAYLTAQQHPEAQLLAPYLAKADRAGTTFCHESSDVVTFDSIGWLISDTVEWVISDTDPTMDSVEVVFRSYGAFDPPLRILQDTTYCPNDEIMYMIDATIRGGVQYLWDDGSMDSMRLFQEEGTFMVTMVVREDICWNHCDTLMIQRQMLPMVSITPDAGAFCETGEIILIPGAEGMIVSFMWEDGSTDAVRAVSEPGTYSVMVIDNCNEAAEASITLTEADFTVRNEISLGVSNPDLCTNGSLLITAVGLQTPSGVVWSTGQRDVISISVTEPGTYSFERPGFCEDFGSTTLTESDFDRTPTVALSTTCVNNQFIRINADGQGIDLRRWSTGETTPFIQVTEAGTYSITVTGICGDEVTDEVTISDDDIQACIIRPPGEVCLRFPNVMVPSDRMDLNQSFGPQIDCPVDNYELRIYNRWGQNIWSSTNPETRWDGTLDGDPAPGDVYFWWAKYGDADQEIQEEGDLTLVR
ncbi:MAG: gliding motility-associated C-terminal domain-containing protein [Bacteroidota bacterium]